MNRYNVEEFSKIINVSQYTLRKLHKDGTFKGVKIGKFPLFHTDDHIELFNRKFLQVPELKEYQND